MIKNIKYQNFHFIILNIYEYLVIDNEWGLINIVKQITEKETALYYIDLIIIQKCLHNFLDSKNF